MFGGWQVWRSARRIDKLEIQESWWFSFSPKAGDPGELKVQFQFRWLASSTPKRSRCFSSSLKVGEWSSVPVQRLSDRKTFLLVGGSAFLFYSGLWLIGWYPPTLGRATCFIQSTNFNITFFQNTLTDIPRIVFAKYMRTSWLSQVDT